MGEVGQREIRTQRRVVAFFQESLGYAYLGDWQDRANNRNVGPELVRDWLERQGYGDGVITRALRDLDKAASLGGSKTLYDANRETYDRLRVWRTYSCTRWSIFWSATTTTGSVS